MTIKFSQIEISDARAIAEIHCQELGEGVVSLFGFSFVRQIYMNLLKVGNWGFLAKDGESVVGFVFATKIQVPLHKCLTISSIGSFLLESIRSPTKFYSFVVAFKEIFLFRKKVKIKPTTTIIELSHFAVRGHYKGAGIGGALIRMLEEQARKESFLGVFTRTHNKKLSDYYVQKKSARIVQSIPLSGHDSIILKWKV